jgi:PAS domain S-box-containing protein
MLPQSDKLRDPTSASATNAMPCITEVEESILGGLRDCEEPASARVILEPWMEKLEHLVDAVVVYEAERFAITHWSMGAVQLFGWSRDEMLGRTPDEISFRARTVQMAMEEEIGRRGDWTGETAFVGKDGRSLVVNERAILVRGEGSHPHSVVVAATNVTDKRRAETELLRMQRLDSMGTLVSGLARDFNNVLAPILMCSPALTAIALEPEVGRLVAETILGSARRGSSLVRQVLSFAHGAERRKLPPERASGHRLADLSEGHPDRGPGRAGSVVERG